MYFNILVFKGALRSFIIGAGVFDAFPKSTLILGHMGEMLPYMTTRIDEGYAMTFHKSKLKKVPVRPHPA